MTTRYLVTGGAGFIGSHVAEALTKGGGSVAVLDNLSTGSRGNLAPIERTVDLIEADVLDLAAVQEAVYGAEVVFHLAAVASVQRSLDDPGGTFDVNARGTHNVLLACTRAGVRRVVFASSAAVYGDALVGAIDEQTERNPVSPYGVQKLIGELLCQQYARHHAIETVALRFFNAYGPRQDPASPYSGVISKLIDALLASAPFTVYGDGEQTRDFVYVEDVARACLLAAEARDISGAAINVGTGQATSVNQLVHAAMRLAGADLRLAHLPERLGDIRASLARVTRAEEVLGFHPATTLETGLARTLGVAPSL